MTNEDDGLHPWQELGKKLAVLRKLAGFTQHTLAPHVQYGRSSIASIETGDQRAKRIFWTRCDDVLITGGSLAKDYDRIMAAARQRRHLEAQRPIALVLDSGTSSSDVLPADPVESGLFVAADAVRRRVESALGDSEVAPASLDDWEGIVAQHARDTRRRPAAVLFTDLLADTDDLRHLIRRRRSGSGRRRATRLTAQMAGLLSLTLLKLNDFSAARQWGRTARTAAAKSGDPATSAWVWAQEAHRYFYADDPGAAIAAAERAQDPSRSARGAGNVLAAALEARARAAIGDAAGTRLALGRAEDLLAALGPGETEPSALGYDEAQLRFHAGNAFTHLGDSGSAWRAQDRALKLYCADDYLDLTLIHLDRAACLIHNGDIQVGARHLVRVPNELAPEHLDRLVVARAHAVIGQVPDNEADSPPVREARDFLNMIHFTGSGLSR